MSNINYDDNILDSRDLAERLEELQTEKQDLETAVEDAQEAVDQAIRELEAIGGEADREAAEQKVEDLQDVVVEAEEALSEWNDENTQELDELENAESEIPEWADGNTLIAESYFEEAMDDMVHECCDLPKNLPSFVMITLDYDALKQDYAEIELDGNTFWYRNC